MRALRYLLATAAVTVMLGACAASGLQDSPSNTRSAQPTTTPSIPAPLPSTAKSSILAGLPGVGTTLSAAGHGYSITLLEVGEWDLPSWGTVSDDSRCTADVRQDHFVIARLRIETDNGVTQAEGGFLGWLAGPPRDSDLYEAARAFAVALDGWCTKEIPSNEWPVPWLRPTTTVDIKSGSPLEAWMVFPISPEVWDSQQLVLYYYPEAGSQTGALQWRLLPRR
jgi:hypothetical protein